MNQNPPKTQDGRLQRSKRGESPQSAYTFLFFFFAFENTLPFSPTSSSTRFQSCVLARDRVVM